MASKLLSSNRSAHERRPSEQESSRWVGLIEKLRCHNNGDDRSHTRQVSHTFHDTELNSEALPPLSLVESMSGEIEALRQRLESVESTKLEFVTLCSHLEDEMEKSHCTSLTEIQHIKAQNEALLEENAKLTEDYQQLKRSNARLIDDYSKRELEYMNHMNDAEKSLRQTGLYYESKIHHQNALIASLCNEVKRLSNISGVESSLDTKIHECNAIEITQDALIPTLLLTQKNVDKLIVDGARVPLMEKKLSEAERTIAQLRDELHKLVDQRHIDSDLSWLELQACGKSLHA